MLKLDFLHVEIRAHRDEENGADVMHPPAGDAVGESHLHAADGKDSANAAENGWAEDDFATLDTADNQAEGNTSHRNAVKTAMP